MRGSSEQVMMFGVPYSEHSCVISKLSLSPTIFLLLLNLPLPLYLG